MLGVDRAILPDSYNGTLNSHAAVKHTATVSDQPTTEMMFKDVPTNILRKIRQIYRQDYEYFSYKMPDWLHNA